MRQGTGNEKDRLALLREHQRRVTAQIAEFTSCLDMITCKVELYEDSLAAGTSDAVWRQREQA
ncbi:MAG: hypothetical protein ACRDQA_22470 [Nocardioidaceae bacterium]